MKILLLVGLLLIGVCLFEKVEESNSQTVWPAPRFLMVPNTPGLFELQPTTLEMTCNMHHRILTEAFARYRRLIFNKRESPGLQETEEPLSVLTHINIRVEDPEALSLSLDTNESYDLLVLEKSAVITAKSVFGVLRALETFSQLAFYNTRGQKVISAVTISDAPRFQYRGFLIDTSRHWLSPTVLKQHIDALAYSKMNVLHWHIVDDQSFPFQSESYPELAGKGAFSPRHIYSKSTIRELIDYAYLRGVRIVPEFDTPGHINSWGKGYPAFLSRNDEQLRLHELTCPLNPVGDFTYELVKGVLTEAAELFPDQFLHVGGDEVPFNCWQQYGTPPHDLFANYESRVLDIVNGLGKTPIVWEEVVLEYNLPPPPGTLVALWKGDWQRKAQMLAERNVQSIVVAPWYLNYIGYGASWESYYQTVIPPNLNSIIGGSGAMWGEFVDNSNSVPRVWPFAAAVAERLWSSNGVNIHEAKERLQNLQCLFVARGIPAQPPNGPSFCPYEYDPPYPFPDLVS